MGPDSTGADFSQTSVGDIIGSITSAAAAGYNTYTQNQLAQARLASQNTMWTVVLVAVVAFAAVAMLK